MVTPILEAKEKRKYHEEEKKLAREQTRVSEIKKYEKSLLSKRRLLFWSLLSIFVISLSIINFILPENILNIGKDILLCFIFPISVTYFFYYKKLNKDLNQIKSNFVKKNFELTNELEKLKGENF